MSKSSNMAVHSLTSLCIGSITTNLWAVQDPTQCLVEYYWFIRDNKQKQMFEEHFKNALLKRIELKIEGITIQLLEMRYVPEYLAVMISRAFVYLVIDMRDWAKTLSLCLQDVDDFHYCLQKSVFTSTGRLDRPNSVTKYMFDSFGMIPIDYSKISHFTPIISEHLESHLHTLYSTPQYGYKKDMMLQTQVILLDMDSPNVSRKEQWSEWEKFDFSVSSSVEVLDFWYNEKKKEKRTVWLCSVLLRIMRDLNNNFKSDKIIYIYHHVEDDKWRELLMEHCHGIISELYKSGHSEYCLLFYKQIRRWQPDACITILETLFCSTDIPSEGVCCKTYIKCRKFAFLSIWDWTDDGLKKTFITSTHSTFILHVTCAYWLDKEYELVRALIKDVIHRDEQRRDYINYLTVYSRTNKLNNYGVYLNKLYEDFNMEIPKYNDEEYRALSVRYSKFIKKTKVQKPNDHYNDYVLSRNRGYLNNDSSGHGCRARDSRALLL